MYSILKTKTIEIEASNEEEAYKKVYEEYDNCNIVLNANDFVGMEIELVE